MNAGNQGDAQAAAGLLADLVPDTSAPAAPGQDRDQGESETGQPGPGHDETAQGSDQQRPAVYGDAAYGTGELLDDADIDAKVKTQPPTNTGGRFTKDAFDIDLEADTVTCPNRVVVPIRRNRDGDGTAADAPGCAAAPRSPLTSAS